MKKENRFFKPTTKNLMVYKVNQAIIMLLRFIFNEKKKAKQVRKQREIIKAQIRSRGRLGFSKAAINKFEINETKALAIGVDVTKQDDSVFYGVITKAGTNGTTRFTKHGNGYFILNAPDTFEKMGYDYTKESFIFEIEKVDYDGNEVLKFTRRNVITGAVK